MDALAAERFAVAGHHTGAAIAAEIAAHAPGRVAALVLSACPFVDAARRQHHAGRRVIDDVAERPDGAHLTELWNRRRPFYPEGDTDLLRRFMVDALRSGPMAVEGHRVVNRYHMEKRLGLIRCPTLVLTPDNDPNAAPGPSGNFTSKDRIPAKFNIDSKLEVEVKKGDPNKFDFSIP